MISILISTYGDEEWQARAMHAAASAHGHEAEIIRWHEDHGTIATSRNAAAANAAQPWLCFLDADDELDPDFVTWMELTIQQVPDPTRFLFTPAVTQIRNRSRIGPRFYPECNLEHANWLVIGTLIHRDLFWEIGGFRDHPHGLEDWNLWHRAHLIKVKRAVYIAHYNHHSKHHEIRRRRIEYQAAYEAARLDV